MGMVDIHRGHRERLRERYIKDGFDSFEDHQILEFLLFYSVARKDTNEAAHRLLNEFGSLADVFDATPEELMKVEGIGVNSAVLISSVSDLFRRYNQSSLGKNPVIRDVSDAIAYAGRLFSGRKYEILYVISLTGKNEVIHARKISEGTLDEVAAYPRKVVEAALDGKAHSVILAHNHPGGSGMPSGADINVTRKIEEALKLVGIELRDHIIVGKDKCVSLRAFKAINKEKQE